MIRLELLGANTHLHSPLCGRCPHGRAGCCESPPAVAWADIGRIVSLGGRDWLLEQVRAGDLRPGPRGLSIRRAAPVPGDPGGPGEAGDPGEGGAWPARCVYLGPRGCSILPEQRSATCNYYLCDTALADGGADRGDARAAQARHVNEALTMLYGRWDLALLDEVRARFPGGPSWDALFLDWLGQRFERLVRRHQGELRALSRRR